MYNKLTKIANVEGRECVACINYGTEMCHIHKDHPDCIHCPMLAAILNQLHAFEVIVCEEGNNEDEK